MFVLEFVRRVLATAADHGEVVLVAVVSLFLIAYLSAVHANTMRRALAVAEKSAADSARVVEKLTEEHKEWGHRLRRMDRILRAILKTHRVYAGALREVDKSTAANLSAQVGQLREILDVIPTMDELAGSQYMSADPGDSDPELRADALPTESAFMVRHSGDPESEGEE